MFFLVNVTTPHLVRVAEMIDAGQLITNVGAILPLADARSDQTSPEYLVNYSVFGRMNMPSPRGFELGIVMAGAISAGAYSAGVMVFLIEALDAYEDAKKQDGWDGPVHDMRIPVMAGASAGGMTAAIFHGLAHVWPGEPVPAKPDNRLYSSWVK